MTNYKPDFYSQLANFKNNKLIEQHHFEYARITKSDNFIFLEGACVKCNLIITFNFNQSIYYSTSLIKQCHNCGKNSAINTEKFNIELIKDQTTLTHLFYCETNCVYHKPLKNDNQKTPAFDGEIKEYVKQLDKKPLFKRVEDKDLLDINNLTMQDLENTLIDILSNESIMTLDGFNKKLTKIGIKKIDEHCFSSFIQIYNGLLNNINFELKQMSDKTKSAYYNNSLLIDKNYNKISDNLSFFNAKPERITINLSKEIAIQPSKIKFVKPKCKCCMSGMAK